MVDIRSAYVICDKCDMLCGDAYLGFGCKQVDGRIGLETWRVEVAFATVDLVRTARGKACLAVRKLNVLRFMSLSPHT